jgi:hypothetical protein
VNGVPIFIRGGDWGLDEAVKRIPLERLDAEIHLHQLANLNMIRNWVGQSTGEDFYELCDKYGILVWDEFFQANPNDGPDPTDIPTYIANVRDKVLRFRNHPSIALWCARNEGYPPPEIDAALRKLLAELEPTRLYQPSSTDGAGVRSHGPYYWRAPRAFYKVTDDYFKTETGSVSVPTLESIHGMTPKKDWETINDDWAEHDLAKGNQHGDLYPLILAGRYGKPFCLLVWFVAPHEPFFRPRRHLDLFRGAVTPKPETFDADLKGYPGKPKGFIDAENKIGTTPSHPACGSLEGMTKDYYSGLVAVDENIGRIVSYLEKKNILDDTAIIQTSDHGYLLGEWRMFDKRLMHEPSIRVPLMVRYPRRIPAGTVRTEIALDIDLAPTFLDLAGLPIPNHMQGKTLLPLAKTPDASFRKEWYFEYYEWPNPEKVPPCRGIRTERYKLIQYVLEPQEFELYDLERDPKEMRNLYGIPEFASVQQHLLERLKALRAAVPERKEMSGA